MAASASAGDAASTCLAALRIGQVPAFRSAVNSAVGVPSPQSFTGVPLASAL